MAHLVPRMIDCYMASMFKKLVAEYYNHDEIKQVIKDSGLTFEQLIVRLPMEDTRTLDLLKEAEKYGISNDQFDECGASFSIKKSMTEYPGKKDETSQLKMEISTLKAELEVYKNIALLKQMQEELQRTTEILASTLEEERAAKRAHAD